MGIRLYRFLFLAAFTLLYTIAHGQADTTQMNERDINTLPAVTLSQSELDGYDQGQDISGLLQSSRDIFASTAGYTFGSARFRMRGYDTENTQVMINGVPMNDMETGRTFWSSWGGLNDAFRSQENYLGLSPNDFGFGGIGGLTYLDVRASQFSRGIKLTYSLTNQAYRNRIMAIASTGKMENGWAISFSGSRRWSKEGYVDGTFYDAWSYFLSVEKEFSPAHSLGLVGIGSPAKRGQNGLAIQEANDLAGSNYYNPYWGFQRGEKRNSRVSNYHQPILMLNHYWTMDAKTRLTSALSYTFGRGGYTALNWTEANDPRPDYYRNLPSYYLGEGDQENAERVQTLWETDEAYRQITWDDFYFANSKFLYTVNDAEGIEGNTVTGYRSKYIVEDRRGDKSQIAFTSRLQKNINEHILLHGGIQLNWYKGFHFSVVDDLLGGEFWLDVDKYADQEPMVITDESQSDLRRPNHMVREGDRYSYDYTANINSYTLFAQGNFSYSRVDFYLTGTASFTSFWRTGNMQNGHFPQNSYGDSEKQQFGNYGLKAGLTYKINGRNYLVASAAYLTRAPYFWNSYVSLRTRDHVVPDLRSEQIISAEASYFLRMARAKGRLTFYYTALNDQTWSRSFYHEDLNTFVNYQMTNVDEIHAGFELGAEINLTSALSLTGTLGMGEFYYSSRPDATISEDNSSEVLSNRKVYIKNYYVGGMPQTIASAGLRYSSSRYWWIGCNFNYFGDTYLEINPDRRTEEAASNLTEDDIRLKQLLEQEKLDNGYTVDIYGGKSWKIKNYYIGLNISLNNLLNATDLASGGYEQFRYDTDDISKFPPRYYYIFGRTFYINLTFRL